MTLTVEDGTGLANADALISVDYADTYHDNRGNSTWVSTSSPADEDKEQAIRRASAFLRDSFKWQGYPISGRSQAMAWPRSGVVDGNGYTVAADGVPDEIQRACAELALRELVTPGALNPDVTLSDTIKREKIGPLEFEYDNSRTDAYASRPVILIVQDIVGALLAQVGNNPLVGRNTRI